jgi:hypothetical protein
LSNTPVARPKRHAVLTALAFAALAILCGTPLLLESAPFEFHLPAYPRPWQTAIACGSVVAVMLAVVGIRAYLDRETEPHVFLLHLVFVALAIVLTAMHWQLVDRIPDIEAWQRDLYSRLFQHTYGAPHQYRPLPYGFVRSVERFTRNWEFSYLSYRAFFSYWLLWAWYQFARTVHVPARSVLTLAPIVVYYPLSILYYWGQLADPISHALLVYAMLCVLEDRPVALAAALALGMMAKETAIVIVPAYLACNWRDGWKTLSTTVALGLVATIAFLTVRLPLGWWPGEKSLNGAGLMIGTNLGIGPPIALTSVPLAENYLHPILFVGIWLPFIAWNWRRCNPRLRALFLTVTPLVMLSNVCYGWLYESRNYVPLLPLLTTMALPVSNSHSLLQPPRSTLPHSI